MLMECIQVNGAEWEIVRKVVKKKSSCARIKKDRMIFEISSALNGEERGKVFENLKKRIMRSIERNNLLPFKKQRIQDGETVTVWGDVYAIKIDHREGKGARGFLHQNIVVLSVPHDIPEEQQQVYIKELMRKIISERKLPELKQMVEEMNKQHFQAQIRTIRFKKQIHRWGSCSQNENINISHRLLLAPKEVVRYVCAHELAHLKEFNHSKRFWEWVGKAVPNYEEKQEWLKNNEHTLMLMDP